MGNPTEVKVLLASVAFALGVYQLVLIAVGYGKLRPRFLLARPASLAHRASGDTILALLVVTAVMCLAYFEIEDDATLHAITGAALLSVLGILVFVLLAVTWASSAGAFLS